MRQQLTARSPSPKPTARSAGTPGRTAVTRMGPSARTSATANSRDAIISAPNGRALLRRSGRGNRHLLPPLAPLLEALQHSEERGDEQHRKTGRGDDAAQ